MSFPTMVFAYAEEAALAGAEDLAAQVERLGFGGIAVALSYHRARRVFPRYERISASPAGHLAIVPERHRYGQLVPECTASPETVRAVHALRAACARRDLRFHAWLVALHHEGLVADLPAAGAETLDGAPGGWSLCPSHPEARRYVAALVEDVCAQLAPDAIELEAAAYPAWEPAYTLTLSLEGIDPRAARLGSQCLCAACSTELERAGENVSELAAAMRAAAGPPFAAVLGAPPPGLEQRIAALRARMLTPLLDVAAGRAHAAGSALRPLAFGDPGTFSLQGLAPPALAAVDGLLIGLGAASGVALRERFEAARLRLGDVPLAASCNWAPSRDPESLAADLLTLRDAGATDVGIYNLTLAPAVALPAFSAAAHSLQESTLGYR